MLGASWQKQANDYSANSVFVPLGAGNLYAPNPYRYDSPHGFIQYRTSEIVQKSLFASDTVQLTERWSVLAGVRYMNYEQRSFQASGAEDPGYRQNGVVTPTFAVMFKLAPTTTAYASYAESLGPGSRVNDVYANAGQVLAAAQQAIRAGDQERARALERDGLAVPHPAQRRICERRERLRAGRRIDHPGIEFGARAKFGARWNAGVDAMLLDAWYANGIGNNGNRVAGAPRFVLAGDFGYAVPGVPGLTLGVDAKFTAATPLRGRRPRRAGLSGRQRGRALPDAGRPPRRDAARVDRQRAEPPLLGIPVRGLRKAGRPAHGEPEREDRLLNGGPAAASHWPERPPAQRRDFPAPKAKRRSGFSKHAPPFRGEP